MQNDNFIGNFLIETKSHLQTMENYLIALDQSGSKSSLSQEIYRSAHTIKGSSSIIKCDAIKEIAHKIESIIQFFMDSGCEMDSDTIDSILAGCDLIGKVLDNMDNPDIYQKDKDIICEELDSAFERVQSEGHINNQTQQTTDSANSKKRKLKNYLIFKTGGNLYAAPLFFISEILSEATIKPINFIEEYILGVINHHGEILPVIDINRRFGSLFKVKKSLEEEKKIIVFKLRDLLLGVKVDCPVRIFTPDKLKSQKETDSVFRSFCDSQYNVDNRIVHSINIDILFTRDKKMYPDGARL